MEAAPFIQANGPNGEPAGVASEPPKTALWQGVDRLVDRARELADLEAHGLHLLAGRRWRELGLPIPASLRQAERGAAFVELMVPTLLDRLRASSTGRLVLMKGPEVAARYPDPCLRVYRDLDLLVADAPKTQRELLRAGFVVTGDPELYVDIHHLRPLVWPGLPLIVEIHDQPKWLKGRRPPPRDELISTAVPSALGIDGIDALAPAEHALVVAAHAWAHVPLNKLCQVVDAAALAEEANPAAIEALAERWGIGRLWRSTRAVADAALYGRSRPLGMRTWARNLEAVRERTVLEAHLESWFAPWWAVPGRQALRETLRSVSVEFQREPQETWRRKLRRTRQAFRDAFAPVSDHDRTLEERDAAAPRYERSA